MTRLVMAGAETGAATVDDLIISGAATIVSTPVRSGIGAYSLASGATNYLRLDWTKTPNRWFYFRYWFRVTALPPSPIEIAMVYDGAGVLSSVFLRSNGTLSLLANTGPVSPPIAINEWHCLEVGVWGDGTTARRVILRLDGTQFDDDTTTGTPTFYGDSMRFGWPRGSGAGTIYFDDIALNDDTGSEQNTWPGTNGQIVQLIPTSDQAIGTDWKLGTGTTPTGNAYDAINNTPPQGVSNGTAGSDTKQIRDNINNTTGPTADADIKLAAYNTVLPADTTVRVAQAIAVLGHTSNTVTQNIEFGLLSSPPETRPTINLQAGAAGIYPSGWRNARATVLYNPIITPTDQPILRLGKRTGSTVAHLCCLAALRLEYEPAPTSIQRFLTIA